MPQSVTDTAGNIWTIAGGVINVNGKPDTTTANVTDLEFVGGKIWQEATTDNLWWSKNGPSDTWSGPTPVNPLKISPNGIVIALFTPRYYDYIYANLHITDASGTDWSFSRNSLVEINDVIDTTTARVYAIAYENGTIWQENADRDWWYHTDSVYPWIQGTNPTLTGMPASPNNTVINDSHQALVDAQGHSWSILRGQVTEDGKIDPTTANVTQMAYENGHIFQENSAGYWYQSSNSGYPWLPGTTHSPVPAGPGYNFSRITAAMINGSPETPGAWGSLGNLKIVNNHTITGFYGSTANQYNFTDDNGVVTRVSGYQQYTPPPSLPSVFIDGATVYVAGRNSNLVVGSFNDGLQSHGFLLDEITKQLTKLDVPGVKDTYVDGISAAGEIFGTYKEVNAPTFSTFVAEPTKNAAGAYFGLGDHFGYSVATLLTGHVDAM